MTIKNPPLLATLFLLISTTACSDDTTAAGGDGGVEDQKAAQSDTAFPNKPEGNPLVPEVAAFPFPSDFFLVKDSKTETGRRVKLTSAVMPKLIPASMFNSADGFSRIPAILAYLTGGIDPKSLPDPTDHALSVSDKSPVWLVKEKTWEKVPILIEIDMMAALDNERSLILRPLKVLDEKSGYVVIVRNKLRDLKGNPHKANAALAALLGGAKTSDPLVEKQRDDFKLVNEALKALKVDQKDVALAWSFHTRSEKQVTSTLLAMQDHMATATLGAPTITSDKVETWGNKNRQVVATFQAPNFVGTDGKIKLDSAGKPVVQGTRKVSFGVTIPPSVTAKRPVILYGHGFFGDWIQGTRGSWNDIAVKYGYTTVLTNMGFHDGLMGLSAAAFGGDMSKFEDIVAEVMQSLANVTALGRLVQTDLVTRLTGKGSSGGKVTLLDKDRLYYHGISNGGTFGFVVAGTSPLVTRASIIVGGGGLIHFLQRAVQWNQFHPLLKIIYPNAFDQQLLMSMVQSVVDPVDSMNYAPRLINNRFSGRKPLKMAVHMAVNDSQVNNLLTEWVARSADIPVITPSAKKIYGLKTITAPSPGGAPAGTLAGMFVYDEKVKASPATNIPPAKDNGTHGTVRKLTVYQKQVSKFLDDGLFVQVCSGPCDPQ